MNTALDIARDFRIEHEISGRRQIVCSQHVAVKSFSSRKTWRWALRLLLVVCSAISPCDGDEPASAIETSRGDRMIFEYFAIETVKIEQRTANMMRDVDSSNWPDRREQLRGQLMEMLGLDPIPARSDLRATITGQIERPDFVVRKVFFQSMPGLYVTANLYLPAKIEGPLPAVLYVCGHGRVAKDGISYGNKVHYHHHGCWFARNGYVCLMIDTLQLGEIEGIHHGTYRENMWWWMNRGYTPAGVEAWNCVRSIDYLQSLAEVDPERIGVTGRSGGGAYSWWITAIDDRIRCSVPVAGITDLRNYVVDGVVEGHCDCMFFCNTHRWDYPLVAALAAPRATLLSNTDRDSIFPLDGVYRTFNRVFEHYRAIGAAENFGLNICFGPHQDTQELRVNAFRWLNHHLKQDDSLIEIAATEFFEPEELKVFESLPKDERNTTIQESFIPLSEPRMPRDESELEELATQWQRQLMTRTFAAWPESNAATVPRELFAVEHGTYTVRGSEVSTQPGIVLPMFTVVPTAANKIENVRLHVIDQDQWDHLVPVLQRMSVSAANSSPVTKSVAASASEYAWLVDVNSKDDTAHVFLPTRGVGPTAWDFSERNRTHVRRRFYLLGQTLDGMRVFDVVQSARVLRRVPTFRSAKIVASARGPMAGIALHAVFAGAPIDAVDLDRLPPSHRHGPFLLNVRRVLDTPQVVAAVARRIPVTMRNGDEDDWSFSINALKRANRQHLLTFSN